MKLIYTNDQLMEIRKVLNPTKNNWQTNNINSIVNISINTINNINRLNQHRKAVDIYRVHAGRALTPREPSIETYIEPSNVLCVVGDADLLNLFCGRWEQMHDEYERLFACSAAYHKLRHAPISALFSYLPVSNITRDILNHMLETSPDMIAQLKSCPDSILMFEEADGMHLPCETRTDGRSSEIMYRQLFSRANNKHSTMWNFGKSHAEIFRLPSSVPEIRDDCLGTVASTMIFNGYVPSEPQFVFGNTNIKEYTDGDISSYV